MLPICLKSVGQHTLQTTARPSITLLGRGILAWRPTVDGLLKVRAASLLCDTAQMAQDHCR